MAHEIITDPDGFLREQSADVSLRWPVLIVSVAAIANSIAAGALLYGFYRIAPEGTGTIFLFSSFVGFLTAFLSVFASWFIAAAVMHGIATMTGGRGSFRETALLSGWGFLPYALTGAFQGVVVSFAMNDVLAGADLRATEPASLLAALGAHPMLAVAPIVTISGLLWSGLLWTFAIRHVHDLPVDRSVAIAAVPTLAAIALTVYGAL